MTTTPPKIDDLADIPDPVRPDLMSAPPVANDEGSPLGLLLLGGLLAALWIFAGWGYVVFVIALLFIIFMHELGHYLTAKWSGMKVTEYFIGFGPRLWSFRKGETEYGVKGIPLGAYVKIVGMNNLEDVAWEDEPRTYRQQSFPKRFLVVLAGSLMHFIMALVLLWAVGAFNGFDQDQDAAWSVRTVREGSAAETMGVEPGDTVLSINGVTYDTWADLLAYTSTNPGADIEMLVDRGGETVTLTGAIGQNPDDPTRGQVGMTRTAFPFVTEGIGGAAPVAAKELGYGIKDSVVGIKDLFGPSGLADLGRKVFSPDPEPTIEEQFNRPISVVGATQIGASITEDGWAGLALFLAGLNIFIGVFNLVPLLPLDGGHAVVAMYERARTRKGRRYMADVSKLLPLAYATLLVLAFVGFATIYLDIADPLPI